jgi:hypothetical protein
MARDCLVHYLNALHIVKCPRKYTTMELWTFQDESHEYGWRWIKLYGLAGCANYLHIFISHLLHHMTKYECIHRYSHQGWEHWNAAVTSFFFRRTQRGGFVREIDNKTKLVTIAIWCQTRMMHVSGTTEKILNGEMLEVEKEIEAKWTEPDEARYTAKLNLRKIRDETTENEREKVAAMAVEQRDRSHASRDKVRLDAEEAMAVIKAPAASSVNRYDLTSVQQLHVQQHMDRREVKLLKKLGKNNHKGTRDNKLW